MAAFGASASVGSGADWDDNAVAEALKATFEAELIERQGPWRDLDEVERGVFQWVGWYTGTDSTPPWLRPPDE